MRNNFVSVALIGLLGLAAPACGGYASYVESEESALGRVVVYRNGIAYYERKAQITAEQEGRLVLEVPADKVDDFLKSLTVADAATGKALPVSFPTQRPTDSGNVEMTIQLPDKGIREVVLTYITESPAWKPTYRVAVQDDGQVELEGWAVVDNTSGEDWQGVRVGVGSSSALSFRYDLRTVRYVHRVTLGGEDRFAKAPPTGGSVHSTQGKKGKAEMVIADLGDDIIPRNAGHPDLVEDETLLAKDAGKRATVSKNVATGQHQIVLEAKAKALAKQLNATSGNVIIEGYAQGGELDARQRSADRAHMLRNKLIEMGVAPARLEVAAKGVVAGRAAGVRIVRDDTPVAGKGEDSDQPVGESHFESKTAMSVERGTSAMVPILTRGTRGDIVYLYDAEAERGNKRYAFKSIRFKNPTKYTLEGGPVTVYGEARFIGEGLFEPVPPGATGIVPFALDRQVVVEREGSTSDRIHKLLSLQRGVLSTEVQHRRKTTLTLTNRLHEPASVFVRHTVRKGWKLVDSPDLFEKLGEAHLFKVTLQAGETQELNIEEATPLVKTIDLRSPIGIDMVKVYLKDATESPRLEKDLRELLKLHAAMDDHRQAIASLRERMDEYRTRMDELHTQIVSLKAVKAGGNLSRHLERKLQDMSERVQKATISVVDHQEQLMLARIRFADGVAELSLEEKVSDAKR